VLAQEAGGDEVFDGGAIVRKVPDFAAGRNSRAGGDDAAIDGEGAANASAEGDADGAGEALGGAGSDFAEQEGGCVVDEFDLRWLPAEADAMPDLRSTPKRLVSLWRIWLMPCS